MYLELFERFVRDGELTLVDTNGGRHRFGDGTPKATWVMRNTSTLPKILKNPALELGQTYMDEGWDVTDGSLADLLTILRSNLSAQVRHTTPLGALRVLLHSWNSLTNSIANEHHH